MSSTVPAIERRRHVAVGYGYVIFCYALIGIGVPVSKDAVAIVPIWPFTAVTLAIGCAMMFPLASFIDHSKWRKISRNTYLKIALQALLGAMLYTVFLLYGLMHTTAIAAGVISSITPAIVLLLSVLLLAERFSIRKIAAIAFAVIAVALMSTTSKDDGATQTTVAGVAFVLLSVLSNASFLVYAKRLATELPPATLVAGLLGFALLMALPLGVYDGLHFDWSTVSRECWYEIAYYGIGVWALPFWTVYLGISRIPASAVGMATALVPVTAVITAVTFYGERLTWQAVVALILVLASIVIAEIHDGPQALLADSG
jgi:drug/metabolite transporter (DMT)-like permease